MPENLALPNTPLTAELAARLTERLADLKGNFSHINAPCPSTNFYDALLLPGTLSLATNPASYLQNLLPQLRPEGAVLGWVLGEGSFPELRHACQQAGFPPLPALPAVQDVGSLLQRLKLALPVVDKDCVTLTVSSFPRLLANLKTHQALQRPPHAGLVTPRQLAALQAAYPQRANGLLPCTLEVIFFHAVQPSASTPKAAQRGSGKVSMVKILSTTE